MVCVPRFLASQSTSQVRLEQKAGGQKHLRTAYRVFDRDHSGGVEPEEFRKVCAELGFVISEDDVAKFFAVHDEDGDGMLNMMEATESA